MAESPRSPIDRSAQRARIAKRRAFRAWYVRRNREMRLRAISVVAAAAAVQLKIGVVLYWSFDRVVTLWRSHPRVVLAQWLRRDVNNARSALRQWRRQYETETQQAQSVEIVAAHTQRRLLSLSFRLIRQHTAKYLRVHTSLQLGSQVSRRYSLARALMLLHALMVVGRRNAYATTTALDVARTRYLHAWRESAIWLEASRCLQEHAAAAHIVRVLRFAVSRLILEAVRRRHGRAAITALNSLATGHQSHSRTRLALRLWTRRNRSIRVPTVPRSAALMHRTRVLRYSLKVWLYAATTRRVLHRLPRWGRSRRLALLRETIAEWYLRSAAMRRTRHLAVFGQNLGRRVSLLHFWAVLRRHMKRQKWVPRVVAVIGRRRLGFAIKQWRCGVVYRQRGPVISVLLAHGERVRFRRHLLQWSQANRHMEQQRRRDDVRITAAAQLRRIALKRRAVRRWLSLHYAAMRSDLLPPPAFLPVRPADRDTSFKQMRVNDFQRGVVHSSAKACAAASHISARPSAFSVVGKGADAVPELVYRSLSRSAAQRTHPYTRSTSPRGVALRGGPQPRSKLHERRLLQNARFRRLWDVRHGIRRWHRGIVVRTHLLERRAALAQVAHHFRTRNGVGGRLQLRRALGLLRCWWSCSSMHGAYVAELAMRRVPLLVSGALRHWRRHVSQTRIGCLGHAHALARFAPLATTPRLALSHQYVTIALAFQSWRMLSRHTTQIRHTQQWLSSRGPCRRSLTSRFWRGLKLAAAARYRPSAYALQQAALLRTLTYWVVATHAVACKNRFVTAAYMVERRRAFARWLQACVDGSLCILTVPTRMTRSNRIALAVQRWLSVCAITAAQRVVEGTTRAEMRRRGWRRWQRVVVVSRLLQMATAYSRNVMRRTSFLDWLDALPRFAHEARMRRHLDWMISHAFKMRFIRRLRLHNLGGALSAVASHEGRATRTLRAFKQILAAAELTSWLKHVSRLAARAQLRTTVLRWGAYLAAQQTVALAADAIFPWRIARALLQGRELRASFVRFHMMAMASQVWHAALSRQWCINLRGAVKHWGVCAGKLSVVKTEEMERIGLADAVRCCRAMHNWNRRLEQMKAICAAMRGLVALRCGSALRWWWQGCHEAAAAAAARKRTVSLGACRWGLRTWHTYAGRLRFHRGQMASAVVHAACISSTRLALCAWSRRSSNAQATAALLSQRARLLRIATKVANSMRRWRAFVRAMYRARRPLLAFGILRWRSRQRARHRAWLDLTPRIATARIAYEAKAPLWAWRAWARYRARDEKTAWREWGQRRVRAMRAVNRLRSRRALIVWREARVRIARSLCAYRTAVAKDTQRRCRQSCMRWRWFMQTCNNQRSDWAQAVAVAGRAALLAAWRFWCRQRVLRFWEQLLAAPAVATTGSPVHTSTSDRGSLELPSAIIRQRILHSMRMWQQRSAIHRAEADAVVTCCGSERVGVPPRNLQAQLEAQRLRAAALEAGRLRAQRDISRQATGHGQASPRTELPQTRKSLHAHKGKPRCNANAAPLPLVQSWIVDKPLSVAAVTPLAESQPLAPLGLGQIHARSRHPNGRSAGDLRQSAPPPGKVRPMW